MLNHITPLILTYNEASNIERSLKRLAWAKRIVIIDSHSTDETLNMLSAYPQVDVFQRKFDTHATQWNFGIEQVKTEWILSLDADYLLSKKLLEELKHICPPNDVDGYFSEFQYCVFGKPLRGAILPPRQLLFRKERSVYVDDGHTQLLTVRGKSAYLKGTVLHDDRKPISRWLSAQDHYMVIEAKKLSESPDTTLSFSDKLRKRKFVAPFVVFFYCLLFKGGILDGWRGWYYAFQRMFAEILLSLRLIEKTMR
jgi:glycosyltransferase involved in cell wall biosynthesis